MIQLPDETLGNGNTALSSVIGAQGASTTDLGMLASRLDLNGQQNINVNNVILIGYQSGGF